MGNSIININDFNELTRNAESGVGIQNFPFGNIYLYQAF